MYTQSLAPDTDLRAVVKRARTVVAVQSFTCPSPSLYFPIGHECLAVDEACEGLATALCFVVSLLPRGWEQVQTLTLAREAQSAFSCWCLKKHCLAGGCRGIVDYSFNNSEYSEWTKRSEDGRTVEHDNNGAFTAARAATVEKGCMIYEAPGSA